MKDYIMQTVVFGRIINTDHGLATHGKHQGYVTEFCPSPVSNSARHIIVDGTVMVSIPEIFYVRLVTTGIRSITLDLLGTKKQDVLVHADEDANRTMITHNVQVYDRGEIYKDNLIVYGQGITIPNRTCDALDMLIDLHIFQPEFKNQLREDPNKFVMYIRAVAGEVNPHIHSITTFGDDGLLLLTNDDRLIVIVEPSAKSIATMMSHYSDLLEDRGIIESIVKDEELGIPSKFKAFIDLIKVVKPKQVVA